MVAYTKDEIVSVSEVSRKFSSIINDLVNHTKEKFAIAKNNKLQAVIVPIDEYERMKEALEMAEHIEIYNIIKEREKTTKDEYVSLEDMADRLGINLDEL
jgi:prevent-host-death family protein